MNRYLALGGVIILLVMSTWAYRVQYIRASEALSVAEARIEGYEEAARIHVRYVNQSQVQDNEFNELTRDLQAIEGRDAPLSDHLRRAAGKLWP